MFFGKIETSITKMRRLLRLKPLRSVVRPYRLCGRGPIALRLGSFRHAVRYSIAGGKIGGKGLLF
jgi:hypothetical protein